MGTRDTLLKGVEHRDVVARVLDGVDQALRTWDVVTTDFLSPPELAEAQQVVGRLTEVTTLGWGGYAQAERQRLAIVRSELDLDPDRVPLALLAMAGNFLFDPASHRDFLGAILGTGIVREKLGDLVLLGDRGAQLILEMNLTQVRSVPVKTQTIPWEDLRVRPPQTKTLTTVEASLRLDAIASAGFGMSRSKMADLITGGDVRVNWKTITQASHSVKSDDLIAIRGKGRLVVGPIAVTKKERYRVELTRYI